MPDMAALNIDDVLKSIGEFGKYQQRLYFLLCIPVIFVGAATFSYVFTSATPEYRCRVPECDSSSSPTYNASFMNFTIPRDEKGNYKSCYRYVFVNNETIDIEKSIASNLNEKRSNIVDNASIDGSVAIAANNSLVNNRLAPSGNDKLANDHSTVVANHRLTVAADDSLVAAAAAATESSAVRNKRGLSSSAVAAPRQQHEAVASSYVMQQSSKDDQCIPQHFSTMTTEDCPAGHIFDHSVYQSTIITEFNLTCEASWEADAAQSTFFAGQLVGCFLFGILADRNGRRIVILVNLLLMAITGIATAMSPDMITFTVMRFLNAATAAGVFQTAYVLGLEMVGPGYRVPCSMAGQYVFALGELVLGVLGMQFRGWRMLQLMISAPLVGGIFYWCIVPESPRWLQTQGKHYEVTKLLRRIAMVNGKALPESLLSTSTGDIQNVTPRSPSLTRDRAETEQGDYGAATLQDSSDLNLSHRRGSSNSNLLRQRSSTTKDPQRLINSYMEPPENMIDLLKTPLLCLRLAVMIFIWMVTTAVYYGISLHTAELGGSDTGPNKPYITFILSALMELPGYTLAIIMQVTIGRKPALALSLLLAGLSCSGAGFVYEQSPGHALMATLIGKVGITSAFGIIYLYTTEVFPTSSRNTVLGLCSTMGRLGGMVAPFSDKLKVFYPPLPLLVFGCASVIAAGAALVQPETKGTKLPATISDALAIGGRRAPLSLVAVGSDDYDQTDSLLPDLENNAQDRVL